MTKFKKAKTPAGKQTCMRDLDRLDKEHNAQREAAASTGEVRLGAPLTRELTFGATPFTLSTYMDNAAAGGPDRHIPSRAFEYKTVQIEPFPQYARIQSHGSQVASTPLAEKVNAVLNDLWSRYSSSYKRLRLGHKGKRVAKWAGRWNKFPIQRALERVEAVARDTMLTPILLKKPEDVMVTFDDLDRTKMRLYMIPSTTVIRSKDLNKDNRADFTHIDFDHRHDYRQYQTHGDFSYSALSTSQTAAPVQGGALGYAHHAAYNNLHWPSSGDEHEDVKELNRELSEGVLQYTNVWMAARGSHETMLALLDTTSMRRSDLVPYPLYNQFVGSKKRQLNLSMLTPRSEHRWGYHAPLSQTQALVWPTEETPHTAIRGDADPREKRLSAELRALSLVVDMNDTESVWHAAGLLCNIRHANYKPVFKDIHEAFEFLRAVWRHNTSRRSL